jgi:hypothetical protein
LGVIASIAALATGCADGKRAATASTWTIVASAGAGGTISPAGTVVVPGGDSRSFTVTPDAGGYAIADVVVDGVSQGALASYTFTSVAADHAITATFRAPPTIDATAGEGGTIEPAGAVAVVPGESQAFAIAPNTGFRIADVVVDGVSQGPIGAYTFANVTAAHAISATFEALPASAVVRLATQGTLPQGTRIGAIQAILTYATGEGLSISAGNVALSTGAAGSLLVANANTAGQVLVLLVHATGLETGEFATATFAIASPNLPAATAFAVAPGAQVLDLDGVPIPGAGVGIAPPDLL